MAQLALLFLLMLAALIAVPVAERIGVPSPILMTLAGTGLAMLPFIPGIDIPPEFILPLVLPPLIYAAIRRTSWRQFTTNWKPITLLAVALIFVTTAAVAALAHAIIPGLPLAAAVAMAALIAPPDPIATTAVAGKLGLPRRLVSILEGEGLFNDVTAIVLYHIAIAAVVTGTFSVPDALTEFALSAVVAILVGVALGWSAGKLAGLLGQTHLRVALTLLVPFASYSLADDLHGSGVLAVLTTAFFLSESVADADDIEGRLAGASFWSIIEVLVTGVAFGLIGLELQNLFHNWSGRLGELLAWGGIITVTLIMVRLLWLLPASWLARRFRTTPQSESEIPATWRETVVVWWSGMRGVATVALALAIPHGTEDGSPFPARSDIIFIAFTVIVATLIIQGMSLPWLIRLLGVQTDADIERRMERRLAAAATDAARHRLKQLDNVEDLPEDIIETVTRQLTAIEARISPELVDEERRELTEHDTQRFRVLHHVQDEIMSAARTAVLDMRSQPGTDPAVVDRVLHLLDMKSR
ncbi:sodium/proton antiporter (CPA1 family) [Stackebrandtia endophytica]|uniref:Sodium/proton antiporter (CPA1 family) n=1 Tax=Stackebrandtia endophytica TaxID=1496996 RepID=A0A543APT8_9ACTN|nr:Na+/H+ antiporter [Stackebrandtia endophytica]TQL74546.1 sodium/proton antiporter (CPA1 family) [Stackebrandtia endophytica]